MDITYISMARGFVYLAVVVDWFSRRVLAWKLSIAMDSSFCIEALEEAIENYGRPEIFNTDQGSQFTSVAFTGRLQEESIEISMDGKGRWADNVFVERCGARSNTSMSICTPTSQSPRREPRSAATSRSITPNVRIPAWGQKRQTGYTSTVRQRHWRHNAQLEPAVEMPV